MPSLRRVFVNSCLTISESTVNSCLITSKFNLNLYLKYKFTELFPTRSLVLRSCVEIVCVEQVVGLYVRQAVMTLRNVMACSSACTASGKLVAEAILRSMRT